METKTTDEVLNELFDRLEKDHPNYKTLIQYRAKFRRGEMTDRHKETVAREYTPYKKVITWVL